MRSRGMTWLACLAGWVVVLSTGCASQLDNRGRAEATVLAKEDAEDPALKVVQALIDAFNRHDSAAMAALVTEDFEYLIVDGDKISKDATGREALQQSMASYFGSFQDVHSVLEHVTITGPYVAFRERVAWTSKSGPRSQASLGVYEVQGGLVRRAWYFPAVERSKGPATPVSP